VQGPSAQAPPDGDAIIDIHQHLNYTGRPDAVLLAHQRTMGVTTTVLLPAGRPVDRPSTNNGASNALEAEALGNEACWQFARAHANDYRFAANEVPDLDDTRAEIEKYLRRGAVMIAEQKFGLARRRCSSSSRLPRTTVCRCSCTGSSSVSISVSSDFTACSRSIRA
jgi:hypothetical protein